jgi:6-phosphogluconolactonase
MNNPEIQVLPTPAEVAHEAARRIVTLADEAIALSGSFTLALAGGSTPKALYELLANDPYNHQIDWSKVQIFFGDERTVPPTDAQSNFRMAKEALLDHVPIPRNQVFRMRGEIEPEAAAIEYGQLLKERFGDGGLDCCLLGMGDDGHTASLFPNTTALSEPKHRCVANRVEKLNTWRITMTAPFINRSRQVILLVTGESKQSRLAEVLEGPRDPQRLPVQLIEPEGRLTWLLDIAAAGMNADDE